MGYSYPGDVNYYPQETPGGATCKAHLITGDYGRSLGAWALWYKWHLQFTS